MDLVNKVRAGKAGQVRYWQYGQAQKSPDLAISDLSRFSRSLSRFSRSQLSRFLNRYFAHISREVTDTMDAHRGLWPTDLSPFDVLSNDGG